MVASIKEGDVLKQESEIGHSNPVTYFSKKFTESQKKRNLSRMTGDKRRCELLLTLAHGKKFKVYSYHIIDCCGCHIFKLIY